MSQQLPQPAQLFIYPDSAPRSAGAALACQARRNTRSKPCQLSGGCISSTRSGAALARQARGNIASKLQQRLKPARQLSCILRPQAPRGQGAAQQLVERSGAAGDLGVGGA